MYIYIYIDVYVCGVGIEAHTVARTSYSRRTGASRLNGTS